MKKSTHLGQLKAKLGQGWLPDPSDEIYVPGGSGRGQYVVKLIGLKEPMLSPAWSCTCPAWKFQKAGLSERNCKHTQSVNTAISQYILESGDGDFSQHWTRHVAIYEEDRDTRFSGEPTPVQIVDLPTEIEVIQW